MEPLVHCFRDWVPLLRGPGFAAVGVPVLRTEAQTLRVVLVGRPPQRRAQLAERTQWLETVSWWVARQALELLPPQSLGWEDWEALKGGRLLELASLG